MRGDPTTNQTTPRGPVARHWNAKAQVLHTQPSQWNPEIRFHKQCINIIWTSNTSTGYLTGTWSAWVCCIAVLPWINIPEAEEKWSYHCVLRMKSFLLRADDFCVWAFLWDPGTSWSWLYPNPHSRGALEQCPIQRCLPLILGYFTEDVLHKRCSL